MDFNIIDVAPCRKKVQVTFSVDEIKEDYKKIFKDYCKTASIPGFRPGKAPESLVKSHFSAKIQQSLQDRLAQKAYKNLLDKWKELKIVNLLSIINENPLEDSLDKSAVYTLTIDVEPVFTVPNYKGITVKFQHNEITEEIVNTVLNNIKRRDAVIKNITDNSYKITAEDTVSISYEGFFNAHSITSWLKEDDLKYGKNDFVTIDLSQGFFIPEFCNALIGISLEEDKQVIVKFPADFQIKELADKEINYSIKIKEINKTILPEDSEFLAKYKINTIEEFRNTIRNDLINRQQSQERKEKVERIFENLVSAVDFELPVSLIEEETKNCLVEFAQEADRLKLDFNEIKDQANDITDIAKQNAIKRVKLRFIIKAIAATENIEIAEKEIADHIKFLSLREKLVHGRVIKEEDIDATKVKENMLSNKVTELLLKSAVIEEEKEEEKK